MASSKSKIERFMAEYEKREDTLLEDYFDFLRIPSVSSEPDHRKDMLRCASWLKQYPSDQISSRYDPNIEDTRPLC
ncbi:MAG: hypothetical protein JRI95_04980 [Deltaproteobacteria bacterium]|nr:hypothetical protein [Deltaproteobacteria bacterium]MBW2086442.1 hypothetical protein [Deltaproteobacteria bacterium]